jgi:acetyl-CoA synthetase
MTMLACTRIGAVHSVVFAGFSAEALAQRVSAAQSRVLMTADVGRRGGKTIPLKDIVNDALTKMDCGKIVQHVLVWERFYGGIESKAPYEMKSIDVRMDPLVDVQRPYCPPVHMDAEDNLFILYTSGSTGMPKGLLHTTGGYALFAKMTTQMVFDLHPGDLFACVADCGWITGHTYVVYGPLLVSVVILVTVLSLIAFFLSISSPRHLSSTERIYDIHVRVNASLPRRRTLLGYGTAPQDYAVLHSSNGNSLAYAIWR